MSRKDVTDLMVVQAYVQAKKEDRWPYDILVEQTGEPEKVCYRAMERACERGYIEYGVSLRCGWVTEKGQQLIDGERTGSKTKGD